MENYWTKTKILKAAYEISATLDLMFPQALIICAWHHQELIIEEPYVSIINSSIKLSGAAWPV